MQDGDFRGPIVLSPSIQRVRLDSSGRSQTDQLPSGFAFLFLETTSTPPFELIREDLLRSAAEKILAEPELVEDQLTALWRLEIPARCSHQ